MSQAAPPQVAVLSLGGTVAMTSSATSGATPRVDAAELVAAVPGLQERARVVTAAYSAAPGASLQFAGLLELLTRLEQLCADGACGLVVTTGTDTIEEVAYFLDLFWRRAEPLVITGAMRTADAAGSDGPANLLAAVTVAADPRARDRGCLVVLNDDVHTARAVRKTHTTRLDAFASVGAPVVGRVHEGRALLRPTEPRHTALPWPTPPTNWPRVALLRLTLDQDAALLDYAAQTQDGVVIEVFGAGHVPSWWVDALTRAHHELPIAVTSRTGAGALARSTYGFHGSERDLVRLGLPLLDEMDGVKARILLMAALLTSHDRKEVANTMSRYASAAFDGSATSS